MADLIENAEWVDGIYQLEENDPVHGGPPNLLVGQGYDNVQAQQLAMRTLWLKAQLAVLQQDFVDLVGGAPEALDTLNELSAALNDDANFAATITQQITDMGAQIPASTEFAKPAIRRSGHRFVPRNGGAQVSTSYGEVIYRIYTDSDGRVSAADVCKLEIQRADGLWLMAAG